MLVGDVADARARRAGCSELIFNPLIEWWRKGPINRQLHTFMWCDAPVHYKVSMTSYMFSYCTSPPPPPPKKND